jgi:hypothetical protein
VDGPAVEVVCTLSGGADAVRRRTDEWRAVAGRARSREAVAGGVALTFDADPAVVAELARLAAAEVACCPFFAFELTVRTDGTGFTATAPDAELVTAVLGPADPR